MKQNKDLLDYLESIPSFLQNNLKALAVLMVAAIVIVSGYSVYSLTQKKAAQSKFTSLYEIESKYLEKKDAFAKAKAELESKNPDKTKTAAVAVGTGDLSKDYGDIPQKLEDFINQNKGSTAAIQASLWLSDLYDEYKMTEKAAQILESTLGGKVDGVMTAMATLRAGNLWSKAEKCEKGIEHWNKLINKNYPYFETQSLLKIALCQKEMGKKDESKAKLQEIITKYPESTEASSAKKYLRLLDYKPNAQTSEQTKSQSSAKDS